MATTRYPNSGDPYSPPLNNEQEIVRKFEEKLKRRYKERFEQQEAALRQKEREIQLLKDENNFLNKRIEHLIEYASLFKEFNEGKI